MYEACYQIIQDMINECDPNFEYEFSKKYQKNKKKLIDKMRGDKYHKLTRNAVRIILIAAIIFAIMVTTAIASPSVRSYFIQTFSTHSVLTASEKYKGTIEDDLVLGYIPEGFEEDWCKTNSTQISKKYSYNEKWFFVTKAVSTGDTTFDSENANLEILTIDNIDYCISEENEKSVSFIYGKYTIAVSGNIQKDELIDIAKQIK